MRTRLTLLLFVTSLVTVPLQAQIDISTQIYKWLAHEDDTTDLSCGDRVNLAITIWDDPPAQNVTNLLITYTFPPHLVVDPDANPAWIGGDPTTDCSFLEGTEVGDTRVVLSCPFVCARHDCLKRGASGSVAFRVKEPTSQTSVWVSAEGTADQLDGIYRETDTLQLEPCPAPEPEIPVLSATLRDSLLIDNDGDGAADPGDTLRYTARVTNEGTGTAIDPLFYLKAPDNTQLVVGSVQASIGSTVSLGNSAGDSSVRVTLRDLFPGASTTLTFDLQVASPLPLSVTTISAQGSADLTVLPQALTDDPDTPQSPDPTVTPLNHSPDLTILKAPDRPSVKAGEIVSFALEWANLGQTATGVRLLETVPEHTTFHEAASTPGWTCPDGAAAGTSCEWNGGTVSSGTGGNATFAVRVADRLPNGFDSTTNRASVTDDGQQGPDKNSANNSAEATVQLLSEPDLSITKEGPPEADAGTVVRYQITYRNTGSTTATGVQIAETIPEYTTFEAGNSPSGWSCPDQAPPGTTCTYTAGNVEPGTSHTVSFAVRVHPTLPEDATTTVNRAAISDDETNGPDPTPANNEDTVTTTLVGTPDLVVTKTGPASVSPGESLIYSVTYRNIGTRDATGVQLVEKVPEHTVVDAGAVDSDASGGWTCANGGVAGDTCHLDIGVLPATAQALTTTFTVRLDPSIPPSVDATLNVVTIQDDGQGGPDQDLSNNRDEHDTKILALPDLTVSKSGPASARPGEIVTYTLTYANIGNRDAADAVLVEYVPVFTTFSAGESSSGWTCTDSGAAGGSCSFTLGDVAAGVPAQTIQFAVRVDSDLISGAESTLNRVEILLDFQSGQDSNPDNNQAQLETTLVAAPNLTVEKSAPDSAVPGRPLVFQVTYGNQGDQNATNVEIVESVPLHTTFLESASSPGWTCPDGSAAGTSCILAKDRIAAGAGGTVAFAVMVDSTVPADAEVIHNRVELRRDPGDDPPDSGDPRDDADSPVVATMDLSIAKSGPATASPGDLLTYELSPANLGNRDASGVFLVESPPPNTTFAAAASHAGWTCSGSPATCRLSLGELRGETHGEPITFAVQVDPQLSTGITSLLNETTITDDGVAGADGNSNNNTASVTTSIIHPEPNDPTILATLTDHLVVDADTDGLADAGDIISYTATVENIGPGGAPNVLLTLPVDPNTELLPDKTTATQSETAPGTWSTTVGSSVALEIPLGEINAGGHATVTFEVLVTDPVPLSVSVISVQGEVLADAAEGEVLDEVVTDDPETSAALDPTLTPVDRQELPPDLHDIPTVSDVGLSAFVALLLFIAARRLRSQDGLGGVAT